jgi:glycosyltransferase involved in cell wall biosynthesis
MSRRLVVLSEIIAPYRIPVFNALAGEEGIDLHVIFLAETDPKLRQWLVYKDEICFSHEVLPSWRGRLGERNLLLNWGLSAALRRASPDAILCGGYNYPASWEAGWWARRHRVPLMVWVESTAHDRRRWRASVEALKRTFLRSCSAFVVPGKLSAEYLRKYDVQEDAVFAAPNAVDIDFFSRHAESVRADAAAYRQKLGLPPRFFLFAGRLVAEKGIFDLLAAYHRLAPELRTNVALVLVGEGPARARFSQRAAHITPGRVQVAGFVQRETLAAYYALADALIFPTRSDPWGLVVNEAMACGLPIVTTTAAGCAADLLAGGWNGYVVSPGDEAGLAAAMDCLTRNPGLRAQMGTSSRLKIRQYSPQICAAGIAQATASLPGGSWREA